MSGEKNKITLCILRLKLRFSESLNDSPRIPRKITHNFIIYCETNCMTNGNKEPE